jgi:DNA mismatch repair protein MutL
MSSINKLDPNLIDQIAAGEVVKRPSSVVKELIENAIDAGADKVEIEIKDGGKKMIKVIDNGVGMDVDDLRVAPQSHTTSKIKSIDDIAQIQTMGFRGEALSSVASVSKMTITSLEKGAKQAYQMKIEGGDKSDPEIASRNRGTTVTVEDIFYNVPARRKFLKTEKTEYRKILEVFTPIALANPHIHFILKSGQRVVHNLPSIKDVNQGTIHPQRLNEVFKDIDFVGLFYDGNGMTIGGVTAHPKHHKSRTRKRYIFVNGRPIWDSGIVKAVSVGAKRFIPSGEKIPFAITINIKSEYVDVNVHPQKAEVRFANPYRVYSAVEKAVKAGYESDLGQHESDAAFSRFRKDGVRSGVHHTEAKDIHHGKSYSAKRSLEFSQKLLEDSNSSNFSPAQKASSDKGRDTDISQSGTPGDQEGINRSMFASYGKTSNLQNDSQSIGTSDVDNLDMPINSIAQFLNKYIIVGYGEELWIIDQHAAAERIRFEKLLETYQSKHVESQSLLTPQTIQLSKEDVAFVEEHIEVLKDLGYEIELEKSTLTIQSIPALMHKGDHADILEEILEELEEYEDFKDKEGILKGKYRDDIIATMACHSSVRMNRHLNQQELIGIFKDLMGCRNSYSCPHGRPIIWRLSPNEIEKNFERS